MNTRKKLALIFGTPITIALVLLAIYYSKVEQKLDQVLNPANDCIITGCSGQVCAKEDVVTHCAFRPEYECYKTAACEMQADGKCGWTMTDELKSCLQDKRS